MRRVTVVAVGAAALALAASAFGSMPLTSLSVSPSHVHRGHSVTVGGNAGSCSVGNRVTIISRAFARTHEFAGVPAVYARVKSGGAFSVRTRIPSSRRIGSYVVSARCGGGNLGITATIHVVA